MKKICIVTICNGSNFGNRLQNYALQETLKCNVIDAEVVTARNISGEIGKKFLKVMWYVICYTADYLLILYLKLLINLKLRKK